MIDRECYGLRALRRATLNGYDVTLLPDEAADVVAEVERLRAALDARDATIAGLRATLAAVDAFDIDYHEVVARAEAAVAALADALTRAATAERERDEARAEVSLLQQEARIRRHISDGLAAEVAAERAAVVATLRRTSNHAVDLDSIADAIERGEHRREGE